MENKSRIRLGLDSVADFFNDQAWFQELKGKWDELDAQSRFYVKTGAAVFAVLLVLVILIKSVMGVYAIKRDLRTKTELLNTLRSANEEIRKLKDANASISASGGQGATSTGPWAPYFEQTAASAGIDKAGLAVGSEKPAAPASSGDQSTVKESLFDLTLKHVNIRQVIRYAFQLESGTRPVKLRHITIDTKEDGSGYMDATLAVSGFALVPK